MLKYFVKQIFVIFLYWAVSITAQSSVIEYPNWFLYPSKFPSITTGYNSPDSTAMQNAAKRKAVLESCIAKGSLFLYEVTDDFDYNKDSDYYYYYSLQRAKELEKNMISIEKYTINVLNDEYIEAFITDTTKIDSIYNLNINKIPRPSWIDGKSFYEKDGYYYSVGMYTSIGRDNDSWITSEEQAMFNLLRNVFIQIKGITKLIDSENDEEDSIERVSEYKLNTKMNNIEIMERFPNKTAQINYTLIRLKVENIIIDK